MADFSSVDDFGGIDADADRLLDECFEQHEAYLAALARSKFLIVGRKGAGKTAIFRKFLKTREHDYFAFGYTFRDYPWHHHDAQKAAGVPEHECFTHSWKYLALLSIAKILLNNDFSQPWSSDSLAQLTSIETFVIDTYGTKDPDVSSIFMPSTKLKLNPSLGFGKFGVNAAISPELVDMDSLPVIIQEVNSNIAHRIITALNPENRYYVLFDELDLGFSKTDPNYLLRLIGLIHAARDLNRAAREMGKNMSIVLFLREDIYQILQFEDKNKFTENYVARIEWDTERTSHTLKEVMARRFSRLFGVDAASAWEFVFDETHKMRGHQTKYQHMIDRTMSRPRDMIKFSNEVLQAHKRGGNSGDKFVNVEVASARPEYSQYLISELEDEIFKHIPAYASIFELLRDLEAVQFGMDEFEEICARRRELVPSGSTAHSILAELFEFSIVGYYQPGGAGYGGAEYVFRYKSPRSLFNASAPSYQVHLGLQEVLGLKRYRRGGGVDDQEDAGED